MFYENQKMQAPATDMDCAARQPEVHEWLNELRNATETAHAAMLELRGRLSAVTRIQPECGGKNGEAQKPLVPLAEALRSASQQARETAALAIDVMARLEV